MDPKRQVSTRPGELPPAEHPSTERLQSVGKNPNFLVPFPMAHTPPPALCPHPSIQCTPSQKVVESQDEKIRSLMSPIVTNTIPRQNTAHKGSKEAASFPSKWREEASLRHSRETRKVHSPRSTEKARGASHGPSEGHRQQVMALQHKQIGKKGNGLKKMQPSNPR